MLRIGIDADPANVRDAAGIEVYVHRILGALGRIDRENLYHLYLRGAPRPDFPRLPENFRIRVIPLPLFWHQARLPLAQFEDRNDILFLPVHRVPVVPIRTPIVATVHDTAFLHRPQSYPPGRRLYLKVSTRILAQRAERIIAISESTAADVARDYPWTAGRVAIIHQGWDRCLSEPVPPQDIARVREKYGLHRPYLLTIGALRPGKNLRRLIEAFSLVVHGSPASSGSSSPDGAAWSPIESHDLVLAGKEDWPHGATREAVYRNGLVDRVHLTGYVPRDELMAILQGATAHVFPSLHEGFGLPALEAMGAGVPSLVSREGSLPEIVGDAALAFDAESSVEMADCMRRVITDAPLREGLIRAGRARAEKFSWEETARRTLDVFQQAARG